MSTASIPTLDQIARDPTSAANLPESILKALLAKCSVVQGALTTQLLDRKPAGAEGSATAPITNPLLDAKEMARLLGVHESWVRTEQRAGRIPFVQVGRYVRFDPAEVQAAIAERTT
jgi:excisionase family DNA binding protein